MMPEHFRRIVAAGTFSEAIVACLARARRSALMITATLLGVASVISLFGLTDSAQARIVSRFDRLAATTVDIKPVSGGTARAIPAEHAARLDALNGARATAVIESLTADLVIAHPAAIGTPLAEPARLPVFAMNATGFAAVEATLRDGRVFDTGHDQRADRVAVIGRAAATALGIESAFPRRQITIDGETFTVLGLIDDVEREPVLLNGVIVPIGWSRQHGLAMSNERAVVATDIGAADLIRRQATYALRPDSPTILEATTPPTPTQLRGQVSSDLRRMLALVAVVGLATSALSIGSFTYATVLERTPEIGLRRAFGAPTWAVAWQFLSEAIALGLVGGIAGGALGTILVTLIARAQGWVPVLNLWIVLAAPLIGVGLGTIAGALPSLRAARIAPVRALNQR